MSTLTYRDPQAPIDERVERLLALMTLDEKLAQLGCIWSTAFISTGTFDPGVVIEKIPHGIGQVTRIGASTGLLPRESAELMNAIQRVVIEQTRLSIPVILHEEATGGLSSREATVFPQGIGLAATWDPTLVRQVASVIRTQMMAVGARHALAPVLDVARDPRWGRVEESYGEDPVLSGTIGTAYVQGLQTDDLRNGVAATGKHFLGYAVSEGGRNWGPVQLGPRELREVYAEPFAAVIREARLKTIMNSYASVDGLPCAGSPAILNDLLRNELGFDGAVVADYGAVRALMDFQRVAATPGEAARLALMAGLDMELPALDCYGAPLKAEIEAGRVSVEVVDTAVRRVLRLKFELGLFENPYVDAEAAAGVFDTPEQRTLAHQAAVESIILLTNDGVLPIASSVKRIAVIGPGADDQRLLQGDYHYPAHQEMIYAAPPNLDDTGLIIPRAPGSYAAGPYFTPHITPLAGLRAILGKDVEVYHAKGCAVTGESQDGFAEAVQLAKLAELAVVIVAGRSGLLRNATVGEANDATSLDLTGAQQQLVDAIADTGTPLVVVVLSGRIHTLTGVARRANALLQVFPPGEEGGSSLAEVLTGKANPSGRLPVSLPRSVGQVPNHAGLRAGGSYPMFYGDYIDSSASPLFAFGHGLSYTAFAYDRLTVQATTTTEPIEVSVEIVNSGERAGDEIVQLYCRDLVASVARPERNLLGFARLSLAPGQAHTVTFTVHPSRLAFYDPCMRFVTEPGAFTFSVGSSAASIQAEKTIRLDGQVAEYRQPEIVATKTTIS